VSADVLAVMERVAKNLHVLSGVKFNAPSSEAFALDEARAAVAKLIAAAGPVLTGDMTTVRGRLEMTRRLRVLAAALARVQGDAA